MIRRSLLLVTLLALASSAHAQGLSDIPPEKAAEVAARFHVWAAAQQPARVDPVQNHSAMARTALPELPPAARSWPNAVGCPRESLEFMRAVEDFAGDHAAMLPASRRPTSPTLLAIGGLGASYWATREAASRSLESRLRADPSEARWLFWGRRHLDPEVRLRCNGILRRLNPCAYCHGVGGFGENTDYAIRCKDCGGGRSTWLWAMWD